MSALSSPATPTRRQAGAGRKEAGRSRAASVLSFHSRAIYSSIRARTSGAGHESRPPLALLGFHSACVLVSEGMCTAAASNLVYFWVLTNRDFERNLFFASKVLNTHEILIIIKPLVWPNFYPLFYLKQITYLKLRSLMCRTYICDPACLRV